MAELPPPPEGIVLAHFIVSDDVERSRRFYTEVLGGRVAFSGPGGLTYVALSDSWIIINVGGGPTDDKPTVTLETPRDPDRVSSFLNIRVKDIAAVYAEWSARGAEFLTPPKQHQYEIRCYIRDPDGHIIEVGQTTDPEGDWTPAHWPSSTRPEGLVLTHFIVSDDVERSRRFYTEVLGGRVVFSGPGEPTYVALSNSWIVINVGGGPTDDKPTVTLETPRDPDRVSSFLNIRVKDIAAVYAEWSARGAEFLTPPKQHQYEIRCYIRDPDGHLIEVGQTTDPEGDWAPAHWPSSTSAEEFGEQTTCSARRRRCLGHDHRDHRHWRARVGHRPPARVRRRDPAPLERRHRVGTNAGCGDRSSCGRRRRQPRRVAGRRCRHPRAAVWRAEGRHRRDRRLAHRQGSWSFRATRSASMHKATSCVCCRKGNPPARS